MQLFFGLLASTMLGVKYKGDKRDQYLQHGGWFVKIALWVICNFVPFLLPAGIINSYGEGPLHYHWTKANFLSRKSTCSQFHPLQMPKQPRLGLDCDAQQQSRGGGPSVPGPTCEPACKLWMVQ